MRCVLGFSNVSIVCKDGRDTAASATFDKVGAEKSAEIMSAR